MGHKQAREINISNELYRVFSLYHWRGNIRELKNVLTYALYSLEGGGDLLTVDHLPERFFRELNTEPKNQPVTQPKIEEQCLTLAGAIAERQTLLAVLASTEQNKSKAAQVLGISRNKLYRKMRAFGL